MSKLFSLAGKTAVVTGGTGVLGGAIAKGLAAAGARVGVLGRRAEVAEARVEEIRAAGGQAVALVADVCQRSSLEFVRDELVADGSSIDVLVNAAGGNDPRATVHGDLDFFSVPEEAFEEVLRLNFLGSVLPDQVFGASMARAGKGSIIHISSMAADRALTRVVAYSAAKAAIDNLTRWLAVEFARRYGPGVRVNAIAPGFFVGEQNRSLLLERGGEPTARGRTILDHTPMARFGEPEELVGPAVWLASDASRFVTGVVVPVDGGFSAQSGV